jgi:hypothetical protein
VRGLSSIARIGEASMPQSRDAFALEHADDVVGERRVARAERTQAEEGRHPCRTLGDGLTGARRERGTSEVVATADRLATRRSLSRADRS